jgi:tRNA(Ile)-lysidine synthase
VQLYRPLLSYSRAQLAEYARDAGLAWIEDESNDSAVHDRNYLRHAVAPALDARFPAWRDALARFARHAASADGLLDEMARDDGPDDDPGLAWDGPHKAMYLHVTLDDERRANALRSFLQRNELPMPASARLVEMARQLYDARDDATVRIEHAGVALVRHRGRAVIESPVAPVSWRVEWRGEPEVELGGDRGCIWIQPGSGEGIDPQRVGQGEWHFGSRMGGERMRLDPAGSTRTLKNLLQEKGLSIRQRQVFPCLFHDGRLVWMSGVGIEADYRVAEGRDGLLPHWRMAFAPSPVLK